MKTLLTGLALSMLASLAHAGEVRVVVKNVTSNSCYVMIALFNDADKFPMDASGAPHKAKVDARSPTTTHVFPDVAPGTWALSIFHDVDGDGELDVRSVIPIPKEPMGASNNAKGRMGPPKFADAAFKVGDGPTEQVVVLNEL